jgi:hypothetical protein
MRGEPEKGKQKKREKEKEKKRKPIGTNEIFIGRRDRYRDVTVTVNGTGREDN